MRACLLIVLRNELCNAESNSLMFGFEANGLKELIIATYFVDWSAARH